MRPIGFRRQALGAHRLEEVVDGGELERLERALLVGGHEHEGGAARESRNGAGEVEPDSAGHVDVEEAASTGSASAAGGPRRPRRPGG